MKTGVVTAAQLAASPGLRLDARAYFESDRDKVARRARDAFPGTRVRVVAVREGYRVTVSQTFQLATADAPFAPTRTKGG